MRRSINQLSARAASAGFSLMEMMVAVVIIGILAAIVFPGYTAYIVRAKRAAVKEHMLSIASREEQFLLDQKQYSALPYSLPSALGLNMVIPSEVRNNYTVTTTTTGTIACPSPVGTTIGYCILATATGTQINDGNLTLDSTGTKNPPAKWIN